MPVFPVNRDLAESLARRPRQIYNQIAMSMLIGSFIVTASVLLPQSSQDFHGRYGEPNRARFAARPGITLTVEYGSDHVACYALIDPPRPLLYSEEQVPLMSSEAVSEVLEEVAPAALRGREINTGPYGEWMQSIPPNGLRARFGNAVNAYLRPFEPGPERADSDHLQARYLPKAEQAAASSQVTRLIPTSAVSPFGT